MLIYAFGLDGLCTKACKGSLPPVDNKLARALLRLILAVRSQDAVIRVDEYMSSKICSSCVKLDNPNITSDFGRQHIYQGETPRNLIRREVLRLVHCKANNGCDKVLHRDGNADSNLATIN